MGMVMFLMFGFAGWLIFQKRGELAARTLRATMIPELEQSRLDPRTKRDVIESLRIVAADIDAQRYNDWQAAGILNRLVRSPLLRWGDLVAVDQWASENLSGDDRDAFHKQITRLMRAVAMDRAIASDLHDVLLTVTASDPREMLGRLKSPLLADDVREVAVRAKLVGDRAEIPDQTFDDISLTEIVERLIEVGARDGST